MGHRYRDIACRILARAAISPHRRRKGSCALLVQVVPRFLAHALLFTHALRNFLTLSLGLSDIPRQFYADQVWLAVKTDEIVYDLAHLVLHANHSRVAHACDALRFLALRLRRLPVAARARQAVDRFACRLIALWKIFVAPLGEVRPSNHRAKALAWFELRQHALQGLGGIGLPPLWKMQIDDSLGLRC